MAGNRKRNRRARRSLRAASRRILDITYIVKEDDRIVYADRNKDRAVRRATVIHNKYGLHLKIVEETLRKSESGPWLVIHKMVHEVNPYKVKVGETPPDRPIPQTPDSAAYQMYVDSLT